MRSIWLLARNWLVGRRGRTALMIAAVALAASLVVAVSCSIGSVQASLEIGIVRILGATDARIIHPSNGRFDQTLLETVRGWPEVRLATGRLGASLTLMHADRRSDPQTGQPLRSTPSALGVDFALEPRFRTQTLTNGRWPSQSHEILLDPLAAEELKAAPGDELIVQRFGAPIPLKVAGIVERQKLGTLQRPFIDLDLQTLGDAANRTGELTSIVILLNPGVKAETFCAKYAGTIPTELLLEPAEKARAGFDRQVTASRFGFTLAAVLTFMSASFIVVTAMTTSVTQRQRDMAIIRCVGASRWQLFGSQLTLGVIVGAAGAAIGIPIGLGLTWLLVTWFAEYLASGLRVESLGLWLAVVGSIASGMLGALYPAYMSSRVAPLQAMAVHASPPRPRALVMCVALAALLVMAQLALMLPADASTRFVAYAFAGIPLVHAAYFILAIPLTVIVLIAVHRPISWVLRLPRGLIRGSVLATPFRHGVTAGALMVGMAILVSTWATATSILQDWLGKVKFADGFAFRTSGISPAEQRAIASLPFVESTCSIVYFPLKVADRQIFGLRGIAPSNVACIGFDPDEFFASNAVEWVAGDPDLAIPRLRDGTGLIVADRFLTTQRVALGDVLTLEAGRIRKSYPIVGAVNSAGLDIATQAFGIRSQYMELSISCVFLSRAEVIRTFNNTDAHMIQLNFPDHVSDETIIERIAEAAPGVQFKSGREILKTIDRIATTMLTVQSTVAFAALVLASIAVGNVLIANIHGRRYEYGVLRAIGAPRGMLGRLIVGEGIIIALTGSLAGGLLGLHMAWVGAGHYRDLAGLPVVLRVPWLPIAAGVFTILMLTLLAAWPAIRSIVRPNPGVLLAAGRHG